MRFDIMPTNRTYSGIDRALSPIDFLIPETKPYYDSLLSLYFSYIDLTCSPSQSLDDDEKSFRTVQDFYQKFCAYHVFCELIIYDTAPIDSVYGAPVTLLGIDIVKDMAESLISDHQQKGTSIEKYLNKLGLFDCLADVNTAINLLRVDDTVWKPCWVYKTMAKNNA